MLLGLRAFHRLGPLCGLRIPDGGDLGVGRLRRDRRRPGPGNRHLVPGGAAAADRPGLGQRAAFHPGYVGIYQFVAVTVLTPFGIGRDAALAYILVAQALGYVVVLAFGLPGLYKLRGGPRDLSRST